MRTQSEGGRPDRSPLHFRRDLLHDFVGMAAAQGDSSHRAQRKAEAFRVIEGGLAERGCRVRGLMGMEDVLKIGLIGCGNVAQYGHSPAINGLDGIELVALADITPARRAIGKACFGLSDEQLYADYRDVLAIDEIEAVAITVPAAVSAGDRAGCLGRRKARAEREADQRCAGDR